MYSEMRLLICDPTRMDRRELPAQHVERVRVSKNYHRREKVKSIRHRHRHRHIHIHRHKSSRNLEKVVRVWTSAKPRQVSLRYASLAIIRERRLSMWTLDRLILPVSSMERTVHHLQTYPPHSHLHFHPRFVPHSHLQLDLRPIQRTKINVPNPLYNHPKPHQLCNQHQLQTQ